MTATENKQKIDYREKLQSIGCKPYKVGKGFAFSIRGKPYSCESAEIWVNPKTNTYYIHGDLRDANPDIFMNQLFQQMQQAQHVRPHQHDENCGCDHGTISQEDIKTVMEQGHVDEARAKELLEKHHDIVQAVVEANQSQNE